MLWIFILGLVITSWTSSMGIISSVSYRSLFPTPSLYSSLVQRKRVLVLDNDLAIYDQNSMATYFFNWPLSKDIFENPDYFENIIIIDQSFQQDPPDVIIDKKNLMKPILERIPRLLPLYKRNGDFYYKINN
jgi:hypothetical protein